MKDARVTDLKNEGLYLSSEWMEHEEQWSLSHALLPVSRNLFTMSRAYFYQ